ETFGDEISRRLKGMHKGTSHIGRVPEGLVEEHARQQRLDQLRSRLDEAIAGENYEEAAGLRDEIQELETPVVVET
ncbi:MAG TPA: excinuclease ABC subunit B, partial [Verrucomicrobiales bacterium]|nr:excinuclease ABC subunit B [Verrucomicrobiales bacterium]